MVLKKPKIWINYTAIVIDSQRKWKNISEPSFFSSYFVSNQTITFYITELLSGDLFPRRRDRQSRLISKSLVLFGAEKTSVYCSKAGCNAGFHWVIWKLLLLFATRGERGEEEGGGDGHIIYMVVCKFVYVCLMGVEGVKEWYSLLV